MVGRAEGKLIMEEHIDIFEEIADEKEAVEYERQREEGAEEKPIND